MIGSLRTGFRKRTTRMSLLMQLNACALRVNYEDFGSKESETLILNKFKSELTDLSELIDQGREDVTGEIYKGM